LGRRDSDAPRLADRKDLPVLLLHLLDHLRAQQAEGAAFQVAIVEGNDAVVPQRVRIWGEVGKTGFVNDRKLGVGGVGHVERDSWF